MSVAPEVTGRRLISNFGSCPNSSRAPKANRPTILRRESDAFDYGYALTVHKAQGSQWNSVVLFDESAAFREDRNLSAVYRHNSGGRTYNHRALIHAGSPPDRLPERGAGTRRAVERSHLRTAFRFVTPAAPGRVPVGRLGPWSVHRRAIYQPGLSPCSCSVPKLAGFL